jgi:hypothetical protein
VYFCFQKYNLRDLRYVVPKLIAMGTFFWYSQITAYINFQCCKLELTYNKCELLPSLNSNEGWVLFKQFWSIRINTKACLTCRDLMMVI